MITIRLYYIIRNDVWFLKTITTTIRFHSTVRYTIRSILQRNKIIDIFIYKVK